MKGSGKAGVILPAVVIALGVFLAAGSRLWFTACGMTEDGGYMSCHWAEVSVSALGVVLAWQGLIALAAKDRRACGAALASAVPVAALICLVPGTLISICAMSGMHCRAMLRPASIAIGLVTVAVALAGAFIELKGTAEDEDE